MSGTLSPGTGRAYGLAWVTRVWRLSRAMAPLAGYGLPPSRDGQRRAAAPSGTPRPSRSLLRC